MAKEHILVGLEVGTSKICVVVGEARDDQLRILAVGESPSSGVRKGEIVDFDNAKECVREALAIAEDRGDVQVENVILGVTGSHVASFNFRGSVEIPSDRDEIDERDLEDVEANAREVSLPPANTVVHTITQHYFVDGQDGVLSPVGMVGHRLEADFHLIHGVATRIQNTIRCVKELNIEVEDVVLNGLASALVVLDNHQKKLGALVIDIGGGTTDYIVYNDGVVKQSGVLAVGGDHITNDISMGLRIPSQRATRLKEEEGSALPGRALPGDVISLRDEPGFAGRDVARETLHTIIHLRVRETLELLRRRLGHESFLDYTGAGVFLTGGCSLLPGIADVAEEVFGMPVTLTHAQNVSGVTSAFQNPRYSTAIGLVKYGQAIAEEYSGGGWLDWIKGVLPGKRRRVG
jgi:cell division protein FtsA